MIINLHRAGFRRSVPSALALASGHFCYVAYLFDCNNEPYLGNTEPLPYIPLMLCGIWRLKLLRAAGYNPPCVGDPVME